MWEKYTIIDVVKGIDEGKFLIPAIQRDFVWKLEQIELLFNSVANNYPIGMFLFWELNRDEANNLGLYRFVKHYKDEFTLYNAQLKQQVSLNNVVAVLDGQQRLSSFYIALMGSVQVKKKYARKRTFVSKELYLNLYNLWDFKFLTEEEAQKVDCTHLWYPVKQFAVCSDRDGFSKLAKWTRNNFKKGALERVDDSNTKKKLEDADNWDDIIDHLNIFHRKLTSEPLIQAYMIKEKDIDRVAEIFIRVNSGGTILSKTDLIYSALASKWDEARDKIKDLLSIVKDDSGYDLNIDFVVKTAFAVVGESLKTNDILKKGAKAAGKIKENWETIENAVLDTVSLLQENNVDDSTLISKNALIPIAVYFALNGTAKNKDDLFMLFVLFLIKQFFSGQSDRALTASVNAMREFKGKSFNLKEYVNLLSGYYKDKDLFITDDDIEDLLNARKGKPMMRIAWLLLYPDRRQSVNYHEDHIHPTYIFKKTGKWQDKKNLLPNIEFVRDNVNLAKNNKPFDEWIKEAFKTKENFRRYAESNYIPYKEKNGEIDYAYYSFDNFEEFFEERKTLLKEQFERVLRKILAKK